MMRTLMNKHLYLGYAGANRIYLIQTNILKALYDNELGIRLLFACMHSRRSGNVLHYRYFLESE